MIIIISDNNYHCSWLMRRARCSNKNILISLTFSHFSYETKQPVTPHFKTDQRARDISRPKALSTEQMQELEFKKMQSEGFKARPVDKRIFQSTGELGGLECLFSVRLIILELCYLLCVSYTEYILWESSCVRRVVIFVLHALSMLNKKAGFLPALF